MEDLIQKFIEMVQKLAPEIWAVVFNQVYIEALGKLLVNLVLWVGMFSTYKFIICKITMAKEPTHIDWDGERHYSYLPTFVFSPGNYYLYRFLGFGSLFLLGLLATMCISDIIGRFVNPGYYAIQILINSIK